MPHPKLGDVVLYTDVLENVDPRSGIIPKSPEYPALVYKIYPNSDFLGLYIFTDTGVRMMRQVTWSVTGEPTPETWRFKDAIPH